MYKILFHKKTKKDIKKLKTVNLDNQARNLINKIRINPFCNQPPYEKLKGNLAGLYSRRINIKHRLVYDVDNENKKIRILSMWSHYGE